MKETIKSLNRLNIFFFRGFIISLFQKTCDGMQAAHEGAQAAQNGAPMVRRGAQVTQNGSRRLTKTSPNPSGWLKKCGLYLLIFEKLNETGLNVR